MPDLPSTLALTTIPTSSEILSVDHRNNYTAIQTAVNALRAALAGGVANQVLLATDSDTVAFGGGYSTYVPTWTSSGTAPALGDGSIAGRYVQFGKLVSVQIILTLGASSTIGTGNYFFSFPVTAQSATLYTPLGGMTFLDSSTGTLYTGTTVKNSTTTVAAYVGVGAIGAAVPVVPASSDVIQLAATYEAA